MQFKKILIIISSLNTGGAQRAVSNLVCGMPDEYEIHLLLNSDKDIVYPYRGKLITLGIDTLNNREGLLYQGIAAIKRIRMLRKLKRIERYDAIISFLDSANFINIITGSYNSKIICSVRAVLTANPSFKYRYIVLPLAKCLYPKCDYLVPNSVGNRISLIEELKVPADKVVAITNGFDISDIQAQSQQDLNISNICPSWNDRDFIFLIVGRLTTQKCQWSAIRAFAKIIKEKYQLNYDNEKNVDTRDISNSGHRDDDSRGVPRLLILGSGVERDYYENLIHEYGIGSYVRVLDFQKNPYPYYRMADTLLMPSLWEGYPNVMCEAMICGCPIIASDFPSGAREILAPDTDIRYTNTNQIELAQYGILLPIHSGKRFNANDALEVSEVLLADAMWRIYSDPSLCEYYRSKSLERSKDFDNESKVKEWMTLLE